ncbi:helix-turn-helix domain-containing protein [Nocardia sp. Marseille-Q1738]
MIIYRWTGIESRALRDAVLLSVDKFAAKLHISARTVINWEAQGAEARLRPTSRELLENALASATPEVVARFERALADSGSQRDETGPRSLATVTLANDTRGPQPPTGPGVDTALLLGLGGEEVDEMQRRELMRAIAVLTAASPAIIAALNADELERTVGAVATSHRVDTAALDNLEAILNQIRLQDDLLGPQAAIRTTLTQADIAEALLTRVPDSLERRLMSLRSKISTSAGWQLFDLGRKESAERQFGKARDAADGIDDHAAGAMALAEWSGMTEEVGKPAVAADQAAAAEARAARTNDPLLRAHVAGIAALALAKSGHTSDTRAALTRADSYNVTTTRGPEESLAYFCTAGHLARMKAKALRQIGDLQAAIEAAEDSLMLQAVRDRAASHILLGTIYVDAGDLDAGIASILAGAEAEAATASARISSQLREARRLVHIRAPGSVTARALDARLAELQLM